MKIKRIKRLIESLNPSEIKELNTLLEEATLVRRIIVKVKDIDSGEAQSFNSKIMQENSVFSCYIKDELFENDNYEKLKKEIVEYFEAFFTDVKLFDYWNK